MAQGYAPRAVQFHPHGVQFDFVRHLHVRPMGCTCRWAGEIKKNTHPKNGTALYRDQGVAGLSEVVVATAGDKLGALAEGVYVVGSGNTGAAAALATMGGIYFAAMAASALAIRRPPDGYDPTAPSTKHISASPTPGTNSSSNATTTSHTSTDSKTRGPAPASAASARVPAAACAAGAAFADGAGKGSGVSPSAADEAADEAAGVRNMTVDEAFRTRQFWLLLTYAEKRRTMRAAVWGSFLDSVLASAGACGNSPCNESRGGQLP